MLLIQKKLKIASTFDNEKLIWKSCEGFPEYKHLWNWETTQFQNSEIFRASESVDYCRSRYKYFLPLSIPQGTSTDLIDKQCEYWMQQECKRRWQSNQWQESGFDYAYLGLDEKKWLPYEDYMEAIVIREFGLLLVRFPANATEDNRLHIHPKSDRRITVIAGAGEFWVSCDGKIEIYPIIQGDRIWMPRGTLHTFKSGNEGMVVESYHSPFVPLTDKNCLIYP